MEKKNLIMKIAKGNKKANNLNIFKIRKNLDTLKYKKEEKN